MGILFNVTTEHFQKKKTPSHDFTSKWKFSESCMHIHRACFLEAIKLDFSKYTLELTSTFTFGAIELYE